MLCFKYKAYLMNNGSEITLFYKALYNSFFLNLRQRNFLSSSSL